MQRPAAVQQLLLTARHFMQPLQAPVLQQTRSMAFVVDVQHNDVDRAYSNLNRQFKAQGMQAELRKRDYRKTTAELKFQANRTAYNKRMGGLILDRLKWVVKRRKLKV